MTLGIHNAAFIVDWQKFTTKWSLYGMSNFHFYHWNYFKVIPLACTLRTRNLPQIICDVWKSVALVRTSAGGPRRIVQLLLYY